MHEISLFGVSARASSCMPSIPLGIGRWRTRRARRLAPQESSSSGQDMVCACGCRCDSMFRSVSSPVIGERLAACCPAAAPVASHHVAVHTSSNGIQFSCPAGYAAMKHWSH